MSELSIIQGPYLQDILGQPQALQDTLRGLDSSKPLNRLVTRLRRGSYQRIVLTGMGGSFHALYPATLELVDHGFNAIRVETSDSPDSTLARCVDAVVRTLAGEEFSVSCKTYVAS